MVSLLCRRRLLCHHPHALSSSLCSVIAPALASFLRSVISSLLRHLDPCFVIVPLLCHYTPCSVVVFLVSTKDQPPLFAWPGKSWFCHRDFFPFPFCHVNDFLDPRPWINNSLGAVVWTRLPVVCAIFPQNSRARTREPTQYSTNKAAPMRGDTASKKLWIQL